MWLVMAIRNNATALRVSLQNCSSGDERYASCVIRAQTPVTILQTQAGKVWEYKGCGLIYVSNYRTVFLEVTGKHENPIRIAVFYWDFNVTSLKPTIFLKMLENHGKHN
jgi:hypothetical protein